MGEKYQLNFLNNSSRGGYAAIFQKLPDTYAGNWIPLAWFTKACNPSTEINFTWSLDYSFVWGETGALKPGIIFKASQTVEADLNMGNQITLDYNEYGYLFSEPASFSQAQGKLVINTTGRVPNNKATLGVGMSGNGSFVIQATPNYAFEYIPHPTYYIVFGDYVQGQVMDSTHFTKAKKIVFDNNEYTKSVTLNSDNTWTV
jgi:hypothetical protein